MTDREYRSRCKQMDKMHQILNYLLGHMEDTLSAEIVSEAFGYNKKYLELIFQKYYEMPFYQFVKKMKLRKSAEALIRNGTVKNEWSIYGYQSNISYSNAFKKEFGSSPRAFLNKGELVPSMPMRMELFETPIKLEYLNVDARSLVGHPIKTEHSGDADIISDAAYALFDPELKESLGALGSWTGLWWNDYNQNNQLYYMVAKDEGDFQNDLRREHIQIPKDYYAVFSFKRFEDDKETAYMMRLLCRYVFREWKLLSYKSPNTMGWIFEHYDEETASLCIPLIKRTEGEGILAYKGYSVDVWTEYIDKHITEKLTIAHLAEIVHYSERSYREIFTMYYEMDPVEYIRKRRLYETALELKRKDVSIEDASKTILRKSSDLVLTAEEEEELEIRKAAKKAMRKITKQYRFSSIEQFKEQFLEEFGVEAEKIDQVKFNPINLMQYYNEHIGSLKISVRTEDDLYFYGKPIKKEMEELHSLDVSELASFWFRESYPSLSGSPLKEIKTKAAVWDSHKDFESGEWINEYILGPVVDGNQLPDEKEGFKLIKMEAGRYAVFETKNESDVAELTKAYRLMTKCAFYGWIHENMFRYSGKRMTFVKYENEKLYFYVPVKN